MTYAADCVQIGAASTHGDAGPPLPPTRGRVAPSAAAERAILAHGSSDSVPRTAVRGCRPPDGAHKRVAGGHSRANGGTLGAQYRRIFSRIFSEFLAAVSWAALVRVGVELPIELRRKRRLSHPACQDCRGPRAVAARVEQHLAAARACSEAGRVGARRAQRATRAAKRRTAHGLVDTAACGARRDSVGATLMDDEGDHNSLCVPLFRRGAHS